MTLIERHRFPEGPEFRKGVPQSRHIHIFMAGGRHIAERLFPGIQDDLISSGARPLDMAEDGNWLTPAGSGPRFRSGVSFLTSTRNLLEWTVRQRVAALPNVRFLERTEVKSLLPSSEGTRVAGVRLRARDDQAGAYPKEPLLASLVVDAGGRNSRASSQFEALGYPPPEETLTNAHPGYATRLFKLPEDTAQDWKIVFVQAAPPQHNRAA